VAVMGRPLACLNLTVDEWARTGGKKSLTKLLDTTFAAVRDSTSLHLLATRHPGSVPIPRPVARGCRNQTARRGL
jgi:hypothetical protein